MEDNTIARIRAFNRFYTNILGLLNKGILDSPYSLSEVRLMLEIDRMEKCTLARLTSRLNIDKGLASRLVGRLVSGGIVAKEPSSGDGRVEHLSLTQEGREVMSGLNAKSDGQISELIQRLSPAEKGKLVESMEYIAACFSGDTVTIRPYRPEDVDYVISGHRELYGRDYGFGSLFAEYVDKTVKAFHRGRDGSREQMWVAEADGRRLGAIAVVKASEDTAQLRWFFVEPEARGHGAGGKLIGTALDFCRGAGYSRVMLWTVDRMVSARKMYAARGFRLAETKPNDTWASYLLTEEKWELAL